MNTSDKADKPERVNDESPKADEREYSETTPSKPLKKELNGPKGLEPTRYGDWESKGRCYDF